MANKSLLPIPEKDAQFFSELENNIWNFYEGYVYGRKRGMLSKIIRALTDEEWRRVQDLVQVFSLPIELSNCGYMSEIGIRIYNHIDLPLIQPQQLILIQDRQVPALSNLSECGDQFFSSAWEKLSLLVDNENNRRLVSYYGLQPLKDRCSYQY